MNKADYQMNMLPYAEKDGAVHPFWAKVNKKGPFWNGTPCWLWTGALTYQGYGRFYIGTDSEVRAHRYAYEQLIGLIPDGLVLDHLCRMEACVNPDHLEAVTDQVNILRGVGTAANAARKTHCPQGHPYSGTNLRSRYVKGRLRRECVVCTKKRWKAVNQQRKNERQASATGKVLKGAE